MSWRECQVPLDTVLDHCCSSGHLPVAGADAYGWGIIHVDLEVGLGGGAVSERLHRSWLVGCRVERSDR